MSQNRSSSANAVERREQPFLYPWNRRLRHLHGVSLRNLNITPQAGRLRGKTITDDDYNLKTAAKVVAQDERKLLHHARSYNDLSKNEKALPKSASKSSPSIDLSPRTPQRPGAGRRRSTLHWTTSSPQVRQQKLEEVESIRMLDTWFSVHHAETTGPIYISEVMEKSMNPSFSHFDLDATAANVIRGEECTVKVWAKNDRTDSYRLLVDVQVNLRSLQFIEKSLDSFHHPLPENCVIFHLADGVYTSFTDLPSQDDVQPKLGATTRTPSRALTSSFDALMQLANLDECIQDALQTRAQLEDEINALLARSKDATSSISPRLEAREDLKTVKTALAAEQKAVEHLRRRRDETGKFLNARRQFMKECEEDRRNTQITTQKTRSTVQSLGRSLNTLDEGANGQIRRICGELLNIFPIEPVKNRALQFMVRGIHLPNSVFDDTNRDEIAAALGFTAQLVHQVSLYLSIPLPYAIQANASESYITDAISMSITQRKFPLHPTNVSYKFEYGVFLLNKDIEFLMNRSGLRVLDVRHTLPNLKYLLYVLTSGSGDLPTRKTGGIRGLLGGRGSPNPSRRGSEDSVRSTNHIPYRERIDSGLNVRVPNVSGEKAGDDNESMFGSPHATGIPYRRSLLRETG